MDLRARHLALRLAHPAQRALNPWTFLLDEWLNVPEGEMVWDYYLYAIRVHLNSRMQSAIRAPDPVRNRRHAPQVRALFGRRTFVHIPQIGEGEAEND